MKYTKHISTLAVLLALMCGASTSAYGAYAESYNNVTNLVLTFDPVSNVTVPSSTPLSAANANLNNQLCATGGLTDTDAEVCNAPLSTPLRIQNAFDTLGITSTEYSNSDAWIPSQQTSGDAFTQVVSIAEGNVTQDGSSGDADSQDTSASTLEYLLDVPPGTTMAIAFKAAPFMSVQLQADEALGSFALSEITTVATLTDNTVGSPTFGQIVFRWKPDGIPGGITGGTETSDPFSLNRNVQTGIPDTGAVYDPTGNGAPAGNLAPANLINYAAISDPLPAGFYTLSLAVETDIGVIRVDAPEQFAGCRLTGGGVSIDDTVGIVWDGITLVDGEDGVNRYQFGGQAGARTALPPQPSGEWQHHQQRGPAGSFSFHAGTASAPAGTEVVEIRCSDPGGCEPSGNPPSPNKQLDFDCVGTFKNLGHGQNKPHFLIPGANVSKGNGNRGYNGTFHWCEVNVDDNGEGPDPAEADSVDCPADGFGEKAATALSNCDCPDFYRLTIYDGVDADDVTFLEDGSIDPATLNTTDVIYEVEGYLGLGGNGLQLHSPTGFDRK